MKTTLYVKMCIILAQLLMESSVSDVRIVLQYLLNTICNYCSHITFHFVIISYMLYIYVTFAGKATYHVHAYNRPYSYYGRLTVISMYHIRMDIRIRMCKLDDNTP